MPPRCAELAARRPGKERRRPGPWVQERGRGRAGPEAEGGGQRPSGSARPARSQPGRGLRPEPGLPGAAAPAPDAAGLRGPLGGPGPGPRSERALPGPRPQLREAARRPAPLSVAAAAQGVPAGSWELEAARSPACPVLKRQDAEKDSPL